MALRRPGKTALQALHRHFTVAVPPLTVVSRSTRPPHLRHRREAEAERIGIRFAIVDE